MKEGKKINTPSYYTNTSVVIAYIIMETTTEKEQVILGATLMAIGQLLVTNSSIPLAPNNNQ